ncbi:MAG: flagellar protein FlgN [Pseudomonadales bacterium]|nr:flagellar protein FlgN [Pseudomonadales bacterium]
MEANNPNQHHTAIREALSLLLETEHTHYQSLLDLLAQEKELLTQRDLDSFTVVLEHKQKAITRLTELARQRDLLLNAAGAEVSKDGMEKLLSDLDTHHEDGPDSEELMATLRVHWQDIIELAEKCRHLNEVNARIASRARSTGQTILDILSGRNGTNLYTPTGRSAQARPQGPVVKA